MMQRPDTNTESFVYYSETPVTTRYGDTLAGGIAHPITGFEFTHKGEVSAVVLQGEQIIDLTNREGVYYDDIAAVVEQVTKSSPDACIVTIGSLLGFEVAEDLIGEPVDASSAPDLLRKLAMAQWYRELTPFHIYHTDEKRQKQDQLAYQIMFSRP